MYRSILRVTRFVTVLFANYEVIIYSDKENATFLEILNFLEFKTALFSSVGHIEQMLDEFKNLYGNFQWKMSASSLH